MKIFDYKGQLFKASYLYVSTIFGVIIGMGVSVLNTRSLIPTEYGDVRYVNNIISFFSGILLLGYFVSSSRLLAVSKSHEETAQIKGGTIFILGMTCIALMVLTAICGLFHEYVLHRQFANLFYLVLPVCMSPLLLNYINTTSQGDNSISMIALARVLPSLCYLCAGVLIYSMIEVTPIRMLWLNNGIAVFVLIVLIIVNKPSFKNLRNSLSLIRNENKAYGRQVYYGSLANITVPYIAGVSLGLMSDNNAEVAFYTLALTISSPLAMAPSVIGTTYFKQFATQFKISSRVVKGTLLVSAISLVCYCIVIFPLVSILYDSSYQIVAVLGCVLALGSTFQGIGDVFNRFLGAHARGKELRNGAWLSGFVSLIGYTLGIWLFGIWGAVATRVLSSFAYLAAMVVYYNIFVRRYE